MARSPVNNLFAFPAEVARFLCVEPEDVKRMMEMDGMPVTRIPKKKRSVARIPLRDLHGWLRDRSAQETASKSAAKPLANYETFLADFNAVARAS